MLPAFVMMFLFLLVPVIVVLYISLTNWTGLGEIPDPRGTQNYTRVLGGSDFYEALRVTIVYTVVAGFGSIAIGFGLAALIRQRLRGWRFYRVAWFIPVLVPGTVTAILFSSAIFAPNVGAVDALLAALGLPTPTQGWLGTPDLAMAAIVMTALWAGTGWPMLILVAAMERIPRDYYDAASIDGADGLAMTRHITLPLVRPVLAAVVTLELIFGLKVFDLVYVMTGGGPADYTRTLTILQYNLGFTSGRFGVAAAIAVLMILIIVPVALIQRYLFARVGD